MHNICHFTLFIFVCISLQAKAQTNVDWAVEQLKSLSPSEYEVLRRYSELPDRLSIKIEDGTMSMNKNVSALSFMRGGDKYSCLSDISTTVHEINHMLNAYYPYYYSKQQSRIFKEKRMHYFYIDNKNEIPVFSNVDFFPSSELVYEISDDQQTYRYNTYIAGVSSTQDDGLLGLLDEYNSYFHSLNTIWDLKNAYLNWPELRPEGYIQWMMQLNTLIDSYYEFRFFILEYLRHAKQSKQAVYMQIKNESDLITVFNIVTQNFRAVIKKYEGELEGFKDYWEKNGYEVRDHEVDFYYIRINGTLVGFKVELDAKQMVNPTLVSSRYSEVIRDLKIIQ